MLREFKRSAPLQGRNVGSIGFGYLHGLAVTMQCPLGNYDACEVCGGDDSTCTGCDGVVNSGVYYDDCLVCGGDGKKCSGCDGVAGSSTKLDICGVCGGNGMSCADCLGIPGGHIKWDYCGVCGGDNSTCSGCDMVPFSGSSFSHSTHLVFSPPCTPACSCRCGAGCMRGLRRRQQLLCQDSSNHAVAGCIGSTARCSPCAVHCTLSVSNHQA
jgi:hypothetical protein